MRTLVSKNLTRTKCSHAINHVRWDWVKIHTGRTIVHAAAVLPALYESCHHSRNWFLYSLNAHKVANEGFKARESLVMSFLFLQKQTWCVWKVINFISFFVVCFIIKIMYHMKLRTVYDVRGAADQMKCLSMCQRINQTECAKISDRPSIEMWWSVLCKSCCKRTKTKHVKRFNAIPLTWQC